MRGGVINYVPMMPRDSSLSGSCSSDLFSFFSRPGLGSLGRFIVLNDSVSLKIIMKVYFIIFRFFLKLLELFECRLGDLYMTANRKFNGFACS